MKKLTPIILMILSSYLLNAQSDNFCSTTYTNTYTKSSYTYDPNGPTKIVRVNFHFSLKSDGTGNFTETSDNYTNFPYNGYLYAEYMIKECNNHWNENQLLLHMPIPAVPANPKKIQFLLSGVFFHRNTTDYDQYNVWNYNENLDEVLNIFIVKPNGSIGGGAGPNSVRIYNAYERYKSSIDNNNTWYNYYAITTINHEIGHCLGLNHPLRWGGGTCCDNINGYCDDSCSDTPTWQELKARGFDDPCCFACDSKSNNLMDYNSDVIALSPGQISRMHEYLDGSYKPYKNCMYKTQSLNITGFTTNKAYIAKSVNIPSTNNIVVGNNNGLFVNAEEFTVNGQLDIQKGSVLTVNIVPACN